MKVVVIGGTGLIGSRLVSRLDAAGHEVVAASLEMGVDALTCWPLSQSPASDITSRSR